MSVLPWTTIAPSRSISRIASTVAPGSGPFITRSPAISTTSGFSFLSALRTASNATALPCTSDRAAIRVVMALRRGGSAEHPFGRDDEAEDAFGGDLAVHARDAAALAEAAAALLHRDLEPQDVARDDEALEAHI